LRRRGADLGHLLLTGDGKGKAGVGVPAADLRAEAEERRRAGEEGVGRFEI
jgi:hypothetical protein